MNGFRRKALIAVVALASVSAGIFSLSKYVGHRTDIEPASTTASADGNAVSTPSQAPQRSLASVPSVPVGSSSADGVHVRYFERVLKGDPTVAAIHDALRPKLPSGPAGDLAAIYVSEGPARSGAQDFVEFMSALHEDIRAHSAELYTLLDTHDAVFKEDPFVYQMALNLGYQLRVSPEKKAQLFGKAFKIPFAKDAQGGVTAMSANITNAFILMKNSGVTVEQARPWIREGMAANAENEEAFQEFVARANAYFPGSI